MDNYSTAVHLSSLADQIDDMLLQARATRDRLFRLECALVLSSAALRADGDNIQKKIEHASGHLREVMREMTELDRATAALSKKSKGRPR